MMRNKPPRPKPNSKPIPAPTAREIEVMQEIAKLLGSLESNASVLRVIQFINLAQQQIVREHNEGKRNEKVRP